ncbi:Sodium/hydrogen exchanger 1 [Vitis vinifera]|uniref:Sodium/hydrogen exchanger 1 n=1 Tax=Vitis vinifera TaxID=29760 RepID=A0A438GDG7_VITVI|nr:Sodium/hydrogen exchanger 1 [Vitis vinifera]
MSASGFAMNIAGDHAQVVLISVFVAVLCLCLVIGHLLEENRWLNESTTAIIIGCITGTIILLLSKGKSSHILRFNEELFFIYLLPPIIFNAGFQVKKKQFFQNFITIMLFGVIGVFISSSIITAGAWWLFPRFGFTGLSAQDYLAIGTIFSSTDTVCTLQVLHQDETPLLYSLVFGEGVVNDATSVVLFNAVQKLDESKLNGWAALRVLLDFLYLFSTSTALGVVAGLLTAYTLKTLYIGRHSTVREIALMVLMAYLSYTLAEVTGHAKRDLSIEGYWTLFLYHSDVTSLHGKEHGVPPGLFHLSGILTVFFCGILMSHYASHNVTQSSRITTRHVQTHYMWHIFATMSFIAETFIFLYVGIDALDIEKWKLSKLRSGDACSIIHLGNLVFLKAHVIHFDIESFSPGKKADTWLNLNWEAFEFWFLRITKSDFLRCRTSVGIYSTVVLLISLGRAAFVFPLSTFSNYVHRRADRLSSISFKHQVIIWWAGLMRGAVSIALAFKQFTYSGVTLDPANATMVTTTIIVVLFTTLVFGFLTKPLISFLQPHHTNNNTSHGEPRSPKEDLSLPLLSLEESAETNILRAKESLSMLIERPVYTIHNYWRKFDDTYMRPVFGGPCRDQSAC